MFARIALRTARAAVRMAPRVAAVGLAGATVAAVAAPAWTPVECGAAEAVPFTGVPGTPTERSFIAIKPDGVQRALVGEIIARFEAKGYKLVGIKMLTPTKAQAEAHYADLAKRPFFPGLVDFFSSGPIVAMVWEGHNVIKGGRVLLGTTNPADSAPGTIRGDYAVVTGRNIIHGSDGPESAKAEITHWFKPEELSSWTPAAKVWIYEGK